MSSEQVPFYAQAAVLDRYIHAPEPNADPEAVEVILDMLQSRKELREYFFRSGPSAAWASVLWEHGFLNDPPLRQETKGGYVLPQWDVQEYLISVAGQVPDIVIMHIESVDGPGWYLSRAVKAVQAIPVEIAARAVPKITEWLGDPQIAPVTAPEADELLIKLAEGGQSGAAFDLFRALSAPLASQEVKREGPYTWDGEAVSKLKRTWDDTEVLPKGLRLLSDLDIKQVVSTLKEHLCEALQLEAEATRSPDFAHVSWWRLAIAETGQELDRTYKNQLLDALRDALESWIHKDAGGVEDVIAQFLGDERKIFRRLGLYLLYRFPQEYQEHVIRELRNAANLDDTSVRNEFLPLLQNGYPFLETPDQQALIEAILSGPSADSLEEVAGRAKKVRDADPVEYVEHYRMEWVLDRLWMLRDHLPSNAAQRLDELISRLGSPQPLTFTRSRTGAYWVRDVSPITQQEIAGMSPDELLRFMQGWQPEPDQQFGPEQVSRGGLGEVMASVAVGSPARYGEYLVPIALIHPAYANALLTAFKEGEHAPVVPWDLILDVCVRLLVSTSPPQGTPDQYEKAWIGVRRSIVWLLQEGLREPEHSIPEGSLPQARDILIVLVDDPDPDPSDDRPPEGWLGHNDPATLALNRVRPSALLTLIEYARLRAQLAIEEETEESGVSQEPGPERLESIVRDALTRKLNRREDPSWAVHSVFGRCLPLLYCLDREWVESHLDDILPEADDEDSIRFFVAAWDSFVIFNGVYPDLLGLLRTKYERAISNLSKGHVTPTHLEPPKHLATHLLWEYIRSEYDLSSPSGQESLIVSFFNQAPPEARGSAARALWRIMSDNPSEIATYWPQARALWEWRARAASQASHSTDFDEEMQWFSHLPLAAPDSETMTSMWPLLEGLLPHITRYEQRSMGWEFIEDYLAREVARDPVKVIELYRLMHDRAIQPRWFYPREEMRKILETAAAHPDSREEALSLIDLLARKGIHTYRDIYERYAG